MSICFTVRHILIALYLYLIIKDLRELVLYVYIIAHMEYNASTNLEIYKNIFLLIFHSI